MSRDSDARLHELAVALARGNWTEVRSAMEWPDTAKLVTGRIEGFLNYCADRQIPLISPEALNEAGQPIDYAAAQIEGATLFGPTLEIITVDGVLLSDGLSNHSGKHLLHLMRSGAVAVTGKRFAKVCRPIIEHRGSHFLVGMSSNFGHWLYNYLSRLYYVKYLPSSENLKFVVPADVATKQIEMMYALGVDHRAIMKIDAAHEHRFERIWISSLLTRHTKRHGGLTVHVKVVDLLQQMVATLDQEPGRKLERRIYLSRATATKRRLLGTEKIDTLLARHGFETIFAEKLTLSEEVNLVRAASVIVAPFGAAMNMCLFCRPGTIVIELKYKPAGFDWLPILADRLGITHIEIVGRPIRAGGSPYDWDFEVDPDDLERAVARAMPA